MYKVISNGEIFGYSDSLVYIRLHKNGCYVPCDRANAEGFCVMPVTVITDENGEEIQTVRNTVFVLPGHTMKGTEPTGTVETVTGQIELAEREDIINILAGGAV